MAAGIRPDDSRDRQQWHALSTVQLGRRWHCAWCHFDRLPRHICYLYELYPDSVQASAPGR